MVVENLPAIRAMFDDALARKEVRVAFACNSCKRHMIQYVEAYDLKSLKEFLQALRPYVLLGAEQAAPEKPASDLAQMSEDELWEFIGKSESTAESGGSEAGS